MTFGNTDDNRVQSNMDKMVAQMTSGLYELETTGNEVLDNLIAKSYDLNIYSDIYGDGKHFLISGELDEIQEKLYGIQELSKDFDVSTGFENNFTEIVFSLTLTSDISFSLPPIARIMLWTVTIILQKMHYNLTLCLL